MEQGRIILAVGLSFLIFLVYDLFFVPKPGPQAPPVAPQAGAEKAIEAPAEGEADPGDQAATEPAAPAAPVEPAVSAADARVLHIETPFYTAELLENGAVFRSFKLKNYRETANPNSPMKEILDLSPPFGKYKLTGERGQLPGVEEAVFKADVTESRLVIENGSRTVRFRWRSPDGVQVEKAFTFSADGYPIGMTVGLVNGSPGPLNDPFGIALFQPKGTDNRQYGFVGPSAFIDNSLSQIEEKKIAKTEPLTGEVTWVAQVDRYFMRALVPEVPIPGTVKLDVIQEKIIESRLVPQNVSLGAGQTGRYEFLLFMGPKSVTVLESVGHQLAKAVHFGMFDFLAKPLLWIMNQIYRVLPNYGVAIIILTIMTKIILWPLGQKSYKSMAEMRKLQPLMANIREKYKNDKKKMNEEMMGLYRTYKINPMGGCLPMVVQIPVFFALYRMLYEAIELRHAPFFGWIQDLSAPDRLFDFGFAVPLMEPPYGIPVLTLVMGATMFLQQKMSPAPGDPTQAKIMMFMPIIFTVIFINFSAGLVLYWLVNNILSIGQQYMIQRRYG